MGQSCASGACQAVPGYCTSTTDCGDGQECQGNLCVTTAVTQAPAPPSGPAPCALSAVYFGYDSETLDPSARDGLASNALQLEQCNLSILREQHLTLVHFNADIPPLLFDHRDKGEARNLADDPVYAGEMLRLTRRMLDHRMTHADSTLSSYSTSDNGLVRAQGVRTSV